MSQPIPRAFLDRIPKTDLHLHLDGSLRVSTLIELAKSSNVPLPSETEEGLYTLVFKEKYKDLPDYLQGFGLTCAVLQTPENLERAAYELARDNIAENVRHIEVRYAPQQHVRPGFTLEEVVLAVDRGLRRAADEHNSSPAVVSGADLPFHYGIIVCAMRFFLPAFSPYYAQLFDALPHAAPREIYGLAATELVRAVVKLVRETGVPVVGFDIAGAEKGFPAAWFREAYALAHKSFLRKTVHAGEAYGPESIFQALTDCHANRIGHGTWIFAADRVADPSIADKEAFVARLVNYVAERRVTLEVCPTSNLQTLPELADISAHPLRKMIDHGLSVSINTDNRLVSRTTPAAELQLVCNGLSLTRHELKNIVIAGFKGSFFPADYPAKRRFVRQVIDRYEALEREFFPA